jgi:hypothetical protein
MTAIDADGQSLVPSTLTHVADLDEAQRQRYELCRLEIGVVQDNIARFDSNGLQVKTWCATTWIALEAFAIKENMAQLAAAGAIVALVFATIELSYRRFQWRFIERSEQIEGLLSDGLDAYKYSVHESAANPHKGEIRHSLTQPHFYTLYGLLALMSVLAWWWLPSTPSGG